MSTIKTTGIIIQNGNGEFLMQLRSSDAPSYKNQWLLFGGHTEGSETPLDCAKRELLEELEINFEDDRFVYAGKELYPNESGEMIETSLFKLHIKPEERIMLGEGAGFGFFKKEEVTNLPMPEFMKNMAEKYF